MQENVTENQISAQNPIKNYIKNLPKRYFITAFSGMAQGLFVTLIVGTILAQIAGWVGDNALGNILLVIANIAKMLMGAGIGVGIAHALKKDKLIVFTAAVTGLIGAFALNIIDGNLVTDLVINGKTVSLIKFGLPGNPIGSYISALLTVELATLYQGKTKLDIILVPLGMLILSIGAIFVSWPFIKLIDLFAELLVITINAGETVKIIVGAMIAIVMGILLTMPTSSAAIWVAIATSNTAVSNPEVFSIAGGAAVAGCAAHMVGFAVASFRENKIGGLISQGVGTSMLQIPNIMKKPLIMLPEIISSAVGGIVAVLLNVRCTAAGGGMGTSGLVGLFGVIDSCTLYNVPVVNMVFGILLCLFVIPAVITFVISEFMRKKGWIEFGDMKLPD